MTGFLIKCYALLYYLWIGFLLKCGVSIDTLVSLIRPTFKPHLNMSPNELDNMIKPIIYKRLMRKHILLPTCLRYSLLLYHILLLFGHKPRLWIGFNKNNNRGYSFHGWVECQDTVFDKVEESFYNLISFQ